MPGESDASRPDTARLLPPSHAGVRLDGLVSRPQTVQRGQAAACAPADSALTLPADDGLPPMPDPVGLAGDTLWELEATRPLIGWWIATSILSAVWLCIHFTGFIPGGLAGLMGGPGIAAGCQRLRRPKAKERPGVKAKKFKDIVANDMVYTSAGVTAFLLASCVALAIYIAATPCDAGLQCLDDSWHRYPRLGSCQCRTTFWTFWLPMSGTIFGAQLALCLMVAQRARKAVKLEEDAAVPV